MRDGSLASNEPREVSVDGKRSHVQPQGTLFAVKKDMVNWRLDRQLDFEQR